MLLFVFLAYKKDKNQKNHQEFARTGRKSVKSDADTFYLRRSGRAVKAKKYTNLQYHASLVALASCLSVAPVLTAEAAELGRIHVHSAYGQPLRAEIDVTATPEEYAGMSPRLAVKEAFRQAGIDYTAILQDLRFSLDKRSNGQPVIRVSSSRPVSDPFLDFLLELKWDGGQRVREYTFLLDPAEDSGRNEKPAVNVASTRGSEPRKAAAVPAPAPAPKPAAAEPKASEPENDLTSEAAPPKPKKRKPAPQIAKAPAKPASEPKPAPELKPAPAADASGQHTVAKGENLTDIARQNLPGGVSLEQMLVGIHRDNPDAFARRNINRLQAGTILNLPGAGSLSSISENEARRYIAAHSNNWSAYRLKLAAAAEQAQARDEAAGTQSGRGRIVPKVEEKPLPNANQRDQVKISRSGPDGKGKPNQGRSAAEEELVAKEQALKEAQNRLTLLERNVNELQKTLELKNQTLAELEKRAQERAKAERKPEAKPAKPAEPAPPPVTQVTPPPPPAVKPELPPQPVPAPVQPPAPSTPTPPLNPPPEAPATAVPPPDAAKPATEEPPKPPENAAPAEQPPVTPKQPPQRPSLEEEPEPEEPGFFDELLGGNLLDFGDDPTLPAAGGGIVALLLGYLLVRRRQAAKAAAETDATEPGLTPPPISLAPNSALASNLADIANSTQPAGSTMLSQMSGDFNSQMGGVVDTGDVDPVAEADVYMAYGRDAQAEEILLEALQKDPQRTAIHVKLLEIYAKRGNPKQFETLASELFSQTGGEGPDWDKALEMGRRIDPANPLFRDRTGTIAPADLGPEEFSVAPPTLMDSPSAESVMPFEVPPAPAFAAPEIPTEMQHAFEEPPPAAPTLMDPRAVTPEPEPVAQTPEDSYDGLDFDLGLDNEPAAPADQAALHDALNQALNLPDYPEPLEAAPAPDEAAGADDNAMDFDFSNLELEPMGDETPAAAPVMPPPAPPARPQVKISIGTANIQKPEPSQPPVAATLERGPHWEEVNTKLDLAKAYEEMGDLEGARELLNEVTSEGDPDQIAVARAGLERLA